MIRLVALTLVAVFTFASPPLALAQASDEIQALRKAVDALREGQERIEKDLSEIKAFLRGRQAAAPDDEPKNLVLSIEDQPFLGEKTAKLALVDFTDYQ